MNNTLCSGSLTHKKDGSEIILNIPKDWIEKNTDGKLARVIFISRAAQEGLARILNEFVLDAFEKGAPEEIVLSFQKKVFREMEDIFEEVRLESVYQKEFAND